MTNKITKEYKKQQRKNLKIMKKKLENELQETKYRDSEGEWEYFVRGLDLPEYAEKKEFLLKSVGYSGIRELAELYEVDYSKA
ncbi:hypothetical protein [Enterococcus innesii]|uniref:hypothetical protein n=1 Tax=Enterococcus innesii TaxID=2839759 RepID=UPI003D7A8D9D